MAEPQKQQMGDGSDNIGQAAGQAAKAAKNAGKQAAKQAAKKGAEAAANAAAATVKASVEGGQPAKPWQKSLPVQPPVVLGGQSSPPHGRCGIPCLRSWSACVFRWFSSLS